MSLLAINVELNNPADPQAVLSKLEVVNLDSTSQTASRLLDPDPRIAGGGGSGTFTNAMSFTPGGKSVAYIIRDQGVDNLFAQPLDGSPGHQITNFTSEHISKFQWSPDGKLLAVVRTHNTSDVVLLQEK
jgi:eukaryotic-like serine/threonine-protein kinase